MSSPQNENDTGQEECLYRFPLLTSYVTIRLDPVKSVEILEDDKATAAAQDAVSKVYVGYLVFYGDWDDEEDDEHVNYLIHLLQSGLPKPSPDEFFEEHMCTPVFPNTDHPSREPLIPSAPLPIGWSHCYHASFETASLCVAVRYAKDGSPIQLPLMARAKHSDAVDKDNAQIRKLLQASQGANLAPTAEFRERAPSAGSTSSEEQDSCIASRQSASSQGRTISSVSVDEDGTSKPVPPPIAVVSYDLAAVSSLEDPQDLLAEVKLMEALYREACTRAKGKLAHAIEEAKKLDEATFNHPGSKLCASNERPRAP